MVNKYFHMICNKFCNKQDNPEILKIGFWSF